jgi:hypothetical protein
MELEVILSEIDSVGIPITNVHLCSELSHGGFEVDNKYLIQLPKYDVDSIIISQIQDGELFDLSPISSVDLLIQFIMEN